MLKKIWEVKFFISNVLFPLFVIFLYFVSFEYLLTRILKIPNGVNFVFVSQSRQYLSVLLVGCFLVFFIILRLSENKKVAFKNPGEKISSGDFILLLLPLTPVLQYTIINQDILPPSGSLYNIFLVIIFIGKVVCYLDGNKIHKWLNRWY